MIVDVETHFGFGCGTEGKAINTRRNDLGFGAMLMRRDHATLQQDSNHNDDQNGHVSWFLRILNPTMEWSNQPLL